MHKVQLYTCHGTDVLRVELSAAATNDQHETRLGDLAICGAHAEDAHAYAYSAALRTRATPHSTCHPCGTLHVFHTDDVRAVTLAFAGPFTCTEWPCLLPQGHWAQHGGPSPRLCVAPPSNLQELVVELSAQLDQPTDPQNQLANADALFLALDDQLRAHSLVPPCWTITDGDTSTREHMTHTYDLLSDALRAPRPTEADSHTVFHEACTAWQDLNAALTQGAPLPDPWRGRS